MLNMTNKTNVGEFIKGLVSEKIYFHPNPGNAGDSLINVGCYDCFQMNGIEYEDFFDALTCESEKYKNKVVVLGGGGGFVPAWSFTRQFVEKFHRVVKKLILLPQTVAGNEDLLNQLGSNVVIFAREKISYEHLKSNLSSGAQVYLSDDMAFNVDLSKVYEDFDVCLPPRHVAKKYINRTRGKIIHAFSGTKLNAFRDDAEKSDVEIPTINYDISLKFSFGNESENLCRFSAKEFLHYISKYELIRTNRLHVAIGASLLGKRVEFFSNSYFKCKAVYDYSLKDNYPNVIWMD
ncbi:polysaccharide pyruvyl transferase family protein [Vibrio cholerae]|nr:polysaccharide pyruvyl transferase family protein [Vibrio cholerae]